VSPASKNRAVQAELDRLVAIGLLDGGQRARIGERYPTGPVDLWALARWLTWLGAVAVAAGVVIVVHELSTGWLLRHKWLVIEGGLSLLGAALIAGGALLRHRRGLPATGTALELLGAMALQGLVVALAVHHSTGSDDWPALIGVVTVVGALLAYALRSRAVLVLAGVEAFVWFGGSTGYASGWGMWWLGMTYPARFLAAGLIFLGVAWLHARFAPPAWRGFARVFAHLGLLDLHLSLWFLSVFGWFTDTSWDGTTLQRLAFSGVWAGVALACVAASARLGLRMLRGYGLTFLLVDVYTFYFQFVAWNSAELWYVHLLVLGAALVGGGIFLERRLRRDQGSMGTMPPRAS
jgi:hypothetical protein